MCWLGLPAEQGTAMLVGPQAWAPHSGDLELSLPEKDKLRIGPEQ